MLPKVPKIDIQTIKATNLSIFNKLNNTNPNKIDANIPITINSFVFIK